MKWARRLRNLLLIGVGVVLVVALAGLPLYVFPVEEPVPTADVVYVIGPPTQVRLEKNDELLARGTAQRSLISVPSDDSYRSRMLKRECSSAETTCATPDPFTTIGEARLLTESGAESAVVITFTPHVARTRFIFDKCFDGAVTVVGVEQHLGVGQWIYQYAYQSAAFIKAFFEPCPS